MTRSDRDASARPVYVLLLPQVHALDFAGAVQAVYEACGFGALYRLRYVGTNPTVRSAQGFTISRVQSLPGPTPDDWVIVPGTESSKLDELIVPVEWLRAAVDCGARVSTVCTGAFALARAGVLDNRTCTTHWKLVDRLRAEAPGAIVRDDRLFVEDGNVVTSAGVASGIDMALALIEHDWGPRVAAQTAREMVVYVRRSGDSSQHSVYLNYRSHLHPAVHRVQDWIIEHPDHRATIEELAALAGVSPRHLTRLFRNATGTTLNAFAQMVRLEVARGLIANAGLTVDELAAHCGFKDARQLRRLWRRHFGKTIREVRSERRASRTSVERRLS